MINNISFTDLNSRAARLAWLEWVMERAIRIPVINKRIGGDALIGLVPGAGDLLGGAIGAYLVYEAWRAGVPRRTLAGMVTRVGVDTAIGAIPVVGDVWDFFYSSNSRNLAKLKAHLEGQGDLPPALGVAGAVPASVG